MENRCVIEVPCGRLAISAGKGYITECRWTKEAVSLPTSPLLRQTARELKEYFSGERKSFDVPLAAEGSDFELAVWRALLTIPYGETRTYSEVASMIGHEKSARAVGNACGKNPLVVLIPCHRVRGKDNDGGYTGGLSLKYALWNVEQIVL
jgi:methylated-DNA-[protein]-cysteine S-methyltransferase